jgi:hypothetical protein
VLVQEVWMNAGMQRENIGPREGVSGRWSENILIQLESDSNLASLGMAQTRVEVQTGRIICTYST